MANRIYPFRLPGLPISLLLAAFLAAVPLAAATPAVMTSPASGSNLAGSSVTFTWSAAPGASGYWLDVGTAQGAKEIFGQNAGLAASQTVSGLPTNGCTIYVRLWTQQGAPPNATWQYNDYTYTAAGDGGTGSLGSLVTMTSPAAGSKLPGSAVTFTWTGAANVTAYSLAVGTAQYQSDLYSNKALGTATSVQVTGLPTDGRTLYVSLYASVNGAEGDKHYTYTAADGTTSGPAPTPPPGAVIPPTPALPGAMPPKMTAIAPGAPTPSSASMPMPAPPSAAASTAGPPTPAPPTATPPSATTVQSGPTVVFPGAAAVPPASGVGDQTPAVFENFPVFSGATPQSVTSTRTTSTWQERVNYTVAQTPAAAVAAYVPQLTSSGWEETARSQSGAATDQSAQVLVDLQKGPTRAHLVFAPSGAGGTHLALTLTTLFPGDSAPSLETGVTATPPTGAATSPLDRGTQDPADFPRLPGSVRTSSASSASSTQVTAYYTAKCFPQQADAFFAQSLAAASWEQTGRDEVINLSVQSDQITLNWQNAKQSANILVTGSTAGGLTVRVILTTRP